MGAKHYQTASGDAPQKPNNGWASYNPAHNAVAANHLIGLFNQSPGLLSAYVPQVLWRDHQVFQSIEPKRFKDFCNQVALKFRKNNSTYLPPIAVGSSNNSNKKKAKKRPQQLADSSFSFDDSSDGFNTGITFSPNHISSPSGPGPLAANTLVAVSADYFSCVSALLEGNALTLASSLLDLSLREP